MKYFVCKMVLEIWILQNLRGASFYESGRKKCSLNILNSIYDFLNTNFFYLTHISRLGKFFFKSFSRTNILRILLFSSTKYIQKIFKDESFKIYNENPTFIPNPAMDLQYKTCGIYKLVYKKVLIMTERRWKFLHFIHPELWISSWGG